MDKTSKNVLEIMNRYPKPEQYAFWLINDAVKLEAKHCGLSVEEFSNVINTLISEGWAEYVFTNGGRRSGVKLTHKGVHYKEFLRIERRNKIIFPATVSVVTSLLVDGIKALLPLILQLLANTP